MGEVSVQLPRPEQPDVVQNGRNAQINGVETDINYVAGGLTLNAAAAYTDAKTKGNICDVGVGSGTGLRHTPDWNDDGTQRRSLLTPIWNAAAGHAQVQGDRHRAIHMADGYRPCACPGRSRVPGIGAVRHALKTRSDQIGLTNLAGARRSSNLFAGYDWRQVQRRAVRHEHLR